MIESKNNVLRIMAVVAATTIVSNVIVTVVIQSTTPSEITVFAQKMGSKLKPLTRSLKRPTWLTLYRSANQIKDF
jgi:hypothetical protein